MDKLPEAAPAPAAHALNPIDLMLGASGVVLVVLLLLIVASTLVWLIWVAKSTQLRALTGNHRKFEQAAASARSAAELIGVASSYSSAPGARIIKALAHRQKEGVVTRDLLSAVAKRAIAAEEQRASALMPTLSSIATASPFIGLFGTVWGIMDAFLRIGVEKSASLPVVAPAIGEALIATAFGLVAAIPATIGYNYVDKRIADLLEELQASSDVWVATLMAEIGSARATAPAPVPFTQRVS
jgi:biopolymer transport protein TolQ